MTLTSADSHVPTLTIEVKAKALVGSCAARTGDRHAERGPPGTAFTPVPSLIQNDTVFTVSTVRRGRRHWVARTDPDVFIYFSGLKCVKDSVTAPSTLLRHQEPNIVNKVDFSEKTEPPLRSPDNPDPSHMAPL